MVGSVGFLVGSMHSVNVASEYKIRNSTSVKVRVNRVYQDPEKPYTEYSLTLREQLSGEFAMETTFCRGIHDELKIAALSSLNVLESKSNTSSFEVEAKIRNAIVNGTMRLKNNIGDYFGTQIELNMGASGLVPMVTISSDISINMFQIQRFFKNLRSNDLEFKNSRIKNVNLLFGLSYGFDGFGVNIGIELAGITMRFPILFTDDMPDTEEHDVESIPYQFVMGGLILAFFAG